jgi:hypothetical protein
MMMKKTLMTTVAVAAVVGFATLAAAQTGDQGKGVAKTLGSTTQEQKIAPGAPSGAIAKPQAQGEAQPEQKRTSPSTQGAGKTDQRVGEDQQKQMTPQRGAQDEQRGATPQRGADKDRATQQKGAREDSDASVQLSRDQRTKIQGIIGHSSRARVESNVHVNVTVGAVVPRDIHVEVLPEDVIQIVPQYEGFDYIIVGDNILIIDPNTMEIVDVVPV